MITSTKTDESIGHNSSNQTQKLQQSTTITPRDHSTTEKPSLHIAHFQLELDILKDNDDDEALQLVNQGRSTKRRRSDFYASGSAQPPPKNDDQSSKKPRESDASASKQHPALTSTGWQITDTRDAGADSSMYKSDPESEHSEQSSDDIPMQDEGNDSEMEDTDNAHIPKMYRKKKLSKADLEGPAFNLVKAFQRTTSSNSGKYKCDHSLRRTTRVRSSSSLLGFFYFDLDFQCPPPLSSLSENAFVYIEYERWLWLSERADTLFSLFPNLLNTPPSFSLNFCLGDLDHSRLILENTLGLGLGLRERLDLCLFSCSLVLIVLDLEYRDVLEDPS
ncbi:hypothetical protein Tco_0967055 [Tanacetum coccineum]